MNRVFLDTVGLLALWNRSDQWHVAATDAYQRGIVARRAEVVTTPFVLLECGNAAARRSFRAEVCLLRDQLESQDLLILPTDDDWQQGWDDYRRGEAGQAGIVDCISFTVMRRLGIRQAFTNDDHFREAGFETLF
jgi:uncharacterized protein